MRIIAIGLFILFFLQLLSAQKTEVYYGVSGRNDVASDIIELYDKGYYISGGFEGTNEYYNGWNIKTDINLELIYDKVLEHSLCSVGNFSSVTDDHGNIYITGLTTISDEWPFVSKLDSCGQYQWCKILQYDNGFNYGFSNDIILNENDDVIVLTTLVSDDQIDMTHLIGLSKDGDVLWKKPYASRNDYSWIRQPLGYSIKEINNDYYISGFCYWPYPDDTTHWFLRPLFIGIDSLFEEKWILPFAPLDSVFGDAYRTIPLNDSVFMGTGIRIINNDTAHSLLMFYDKNGNELGYNEIQNSQIGNNIAFNLHSDIQRINDSLFLTTAYLGSEELGNPHSEFIIDTACNLYNYSLRLNTNGWAHLIKTYDNKYVITTGIDENKGDSDIYVYKIDENLEMVPFDPTPHNYDSLCPGGIQSGTIDLTSCLVWTNIGDAPSPKEYYESIRKIPVKAYPNPVSEGSITFEYENTEHHRKMELRCFDIYGELEHKEKVYRYQSESVVDIGGWRKGMYVAVVYSKGLPAGQCKFVVQ